MGMMRLRALLLLPIVLSAVAISPVDKGFKDIGNGMYYMWYSKPGGVRQVLTMILKEGQTTFKFIPDCGPPYCTEETDKIVIKKVDEKGVVVTEDIPKSGWNGAGGESEGTQTGHSPSDYDFVDDGFGEFVREFTNSDGTKYMVYMTITPEGKADFTFYPTTNGAEPPGDEDKVGNDEFENGYFLPEGEGDEKTRIPVDGWIVPRGPSTTRSTLQRSERMSKKWNKHHPEDYGFYDNTKGKWVRTFTDEENKSFQVQLKIKDGKAIFIKHITNKGKTERKKAFTHGQWYFPEGQGKGKLMIPVEGWADGVTKVVAVPMEETDTVSEDESETGPKDTPSSPLPPGSNDQPKSEPVPDTNPRSPTDPQYSFYVNEGGEYVRLFTKSDTSYWAYMRVDRNGDATFRFPKEQKPRMKEAVIRGAWFYPFGIEDNEKIPVTGWTVNSHATDSTTGAPKAMRRVGKVAPHEGHAEVKIKRTQNAAEKPEEAWKRTSK